MYIVVDTQMMLGSWGGHSIEFGPQGCNRFLTSAGAPATVPLVLNP